MMIAVSGKTLVNLIQEAPMSDPIWVSRMEIINRIMPPTDCIYEVVRWYLGTPKLARAQSLLRRAAPDLEAATASLLSDTMISAPHKCEWGAYQPGHLLILLLHLKTVRPNLLCLPELVCPMAPIQDYIQVIDAIGGASTLSNSALVLPDGAAN